MIRQGGKLDDDDFQDFQEAPKAGAAEDSFTDFQGESGAPTTGVTPSQSRFGSDLQPHTAPRLHESPSPAVLSE